ncbi:B box and SPRY domain-containing protein [Trichomycterus rosablanca]|uniref:B box and SPRY domain-containing protein n=1 Tax=Trichomycterus rosablanca TaxID=2290929 RepID=UPI002F352272
MSADYALCELAVVSLQDSEHEPASSGDQNTSDFPPRLTEDALWRKFQYTNGTSNGNSSTDSSINEVKLCPEHDLVLDRYCGTEGKAVCSMCVDEGTCRNHTVTKLEEKATAARNKLVDICEKMQLQALRIERFIKHTLTAKEKNMQAEASSARERIVAQVNTIREALEEEEQRLLEAVQREEERIEQCLLTQQAHWSQALNTLTHARTSLVHTLTDSTDAMLVSSNQEILARIEEAEGVSDPKDTEQLNMNRDCSDSKLLLGLWASALLLGPTGHGSGTLYFDERTISPLLLLSSDRRTLNFLSKRRRQSVQYDPARFDSWPNALCCDPISSGTHAWVLDVGNSEAFKVGVCYASMERKGSDNSSRLGYNAKSWVLSHYDGDFSFCHNGQNINLSVVKSPTKVGVLVDWTKHTLLFFDPDSNCVLHSVRQAFSEPLLAACAVADQSMTIVH